MAVKRRVGFLRSVRWRLTLTYLAMLAALLSVFAVYQYVSLRQSLITARVTALQDDVNTTRQLLSRVGQTATTARLAVLCTSAAGVPLAARTVATTAAATSGHTVAVMVYNSALQSVAQAPAGATLPHLSPDGLQHALRGSRSPAEVVQGVDGQNLLMVGFPIRQGVNGGRVCGVAQLSTSMAPIQTVLNDELLLLGFGAGATLLLALAAGLVLTGRALRPLGRLTATAGKLAGGDLRARSGVEERRDEIGALARSFDDMAERIEHSFTTQRQTDERTRRFIADASHELRTPVTALSGYIDVIRRGATPSAEALDAALEAMSREAARMRALVLDLLTLARLDAQPPSAPAAVDLSQAIERHLDEGVPGMPAQVVRDLSGGVIAAADAASVDTVIRNLLVNACKYAPGATQVWRTWRYDARVLFSVTDAGPGIAAADLPHIFERFYRGEKARGRSEGGSGLGLSIVQGLVRADGGEVTIESSEGSGTKVTVVLPAAQPRDDG